MHFDRLDERNTMVKSNPPFENFAKAGLTALGTRLNRHAQNDSKTLLMPISVVNICPPVSW